MVKLLHSNVSSPRCADEILACADGGLSFKMACVKSGRPIGRWIIAADARTLSWHWEIETAGCGSESQLAA